jgi:aspartyl-tRNA(Asn)/glutamyl-tRNA(Gln) amidotransferase subunit A
LSLRGVFPLSWSLDTAGPMARSVSDCATLMAAVDVLDVDDPTAESGDRRDVTSGLGAGVRGLRVLVAENYFLATARGDVAAAISAAARVFDGLGADVQTVELAGVDTLARMNGTIALSEAATVHAVDIADRPGSIGSDVLARLRRGQGVAGTDYAMARRLGVEWRHRMRALLGDDGVLLAPTTRFPAPVIDGIDSVGAADQLTAFTAPFNLMGLPALSVPCGFSSEGLPIGLQIVGGPWRDDLVLRAGDAYERATDWHLAHPPV